MSAAICGCSATGLGCRSHIGDTVAINLKLTIVQLAYLLDMAEVSGAGPMDWKQFLASVIGSLAWPVAVVSIVYIFKDRIGFLIGQIRKIGAGGA